MSSTFNSIKKSNMATSRNIAELQRDIMKSMQKAVRVTEQKALADMYEETGGFYTGGEPVMYERTGALGDTPKTTSPKVNNDSVSFEAYLDQSHGYTTGKNPSMTDVLHLTNDGNYHGLRPAVGKTGFWDRAEEKIEKDLNSTMGSFFK